MRKCIFSKILMAMAVMVMSLALTGCDNEDVWAYPILVRHKGNN